MVGDAAQRVALKRPHPGQHLPISLAGRGETMSSQNAILFVHDRRDMQISLCVSTPPTMRRPNPSMTAIPSLQL
jgi:hypothetical protein